MSNSKLDIKLGLLVSQAFTHADARRAEGWQPAGEYRQYGYDYQPHDRPARRILVDDIQLKGGA